MFLFLLKPSITEIKTNHFFRARIFYSLITNKIQYVQFTFYCYIFSSSNRKQFLHNIIGINSNPGSFGLNMCFLNGKERFIIMFPKCVFVVAGVFLLLALDHWRKFGTFGISNGLLFNSQTFRLLCWLGCNLLCCQTSASTGDCWTSP